MLYFVTGTPGAGKTLFVVQMLANEQNKARKEKRACRPLFANIEGLRLGGVLSAPDDWREVPDGALVVYDEAQQLFPATGRAGLSEDSRIRDMDTHRHRGIDIWFITQHSTRVHHDVRKLASGHYHVENIFGTQAATVFSNGRVFSEGDANDRALCDQEVWRYPKYLYGAYQSATKHTRKRRIPKKVFAVLGLALCGLGAAWWFSDFTLGGKLEASPGGGQVEPVVAGQVVASGEGSGGESEAPPAPSVVSFMDPVHRVSWAPVTERVQAQVSGCIATAKRCRCYSDDGHPLEMAWRDCRARVDGPYPRSISVGDSERGGSSSRGAGTSAVPQPARQSAESSRFVSSGSSNAYPGMPR